MLVHILFDHLQSNMYGEQYSSSTVRLDQSISNPHSYYLDSYSYPFRSTTASSNVYFPSHQHPFASSTTQDLTSYTNYDATYLNVAMAAAYQNHYQTTDPFELNSFRSTNNEPTMEVDRKISNTNRKRKYPDETLSNRNTSSVIVYHVLLLCRISIRI